MTFYAAYMTADILTPDDTDTNCYGEPTEPGHGQTLESGWIDPSWSRWTVYQEQEDVRPIAVYLSDDGTLAEWREATVREWFGDWFHGPDGTDRVTDDNDTYYDSTGDGEDNYDTGATLTGRAIHFWRLENLP